MIVSFRQELVLTTIKTSVSGRVLRIATSRGSYSRNSEIINVAIENDHVASIRGLHRLIASCQVNDRQAAKPGTTDPHTIPSRRPAHGERGAESASCSSTIYDWVDCRTAIKPHISKQRDRARRLSHGPTGSAVIWLLRRGMLAV
jgi:hypothetical protein